MFVLPYVQFVLLYKSFLFERFLMNILKNLIIIVLNIYPKYLKFLQSKNQCLFELKDNHLLKENSVFYFFEMKHHQIVFYFFLENCRCYLVHFVGH